MHDYKPSRGEGGREGGGGGGADGNKVQPGPLEVDKWLI